MKKINKNEFSNEVKKVRYDEKVSHEHSQCINENESETREGSFYKVNGETLKFISPTNISF